MTDTTTRAEPTSSDHRPEDMVLSFLTMRRVLGLLGLLLPVVLVIGGALHECCVRLSISAYYHSESPVLHGLFVGTMAAIGVFLICYKGYRRKEGDLLGDNWLATAAGIGALGVAVFPIERSAVVDWCSNTWCSCIAHQAGCQGTCRDTVFSYLHIGSAGLFFASTALIAWCLFTKGGDCKQTDRERKQKERRNSIYRVCAGIIFVCILLIVAAVAISRLMDSTTFDQIRGVLILEGIAVWAFGVAWLVKGRPLWNGVKEVAEPPSDSSS